VLLTLEEDLYPRISDGTIPPGAIRPLVELAKIHPGLPGRAVAEIAAVDTGDHADEPYTWADLARDPLQVAAADPEQLPSDIYTTAVAYPLQRFTLTEKAGRDLAKWAQLENREATELEVRFDGEDLAAAEQLGAAYHGANGWAAVIVGQEIADQIVCDQIKGLVKEAREWAKRQRDAGEPAGAPQASEGDGGEAPPSEEAVKEQRRAEREAEQQARREAAGHNAELGAACVKHLARVKVDERVVRILSAFDLGGELDKITLRGGRYGLPGWVVDEQRNRALLR